jgi:hypothetical protein
VAAQQRADGTQVRRLVVDDQDPALRQRGVVRLPGMFRVARHLEAVNEG